MSVSLIIPTRNQHRVLNQALISIANANLQGLGNVEIIVIDNQSDDLESQHYLNHLTQQATDWGLKNLSILPFNETFNYSKMNNLAAHASSGEVLCFLNNDIEVISNDWLTHLTHEALEPNTGCVGALLFFPDNTVQHAGVILGMGTIAGHAYVGLPKSVTNTHPYFQSPRRCSAVTGACLAVKKTVFEQIGGFNESLPVAFNDVDLCLKAQQAGLHNQFLPHVQLYHHESLSRGKGIKTEAQKIQHQNEIRIFSQHWPQNTSHDPFWIRTKKPVYLAHFFAKKSTACTFKPSWWQLSREHYQHRDLA